MNVQSFFQSSFTYAIIGASNDSSKFGNKVFLEMKTAGYKVIPINPNDPFIEETPAYASVLQYPDELDVAIFVVPPKITEHVLRECKDKGITKVWLQPGSENELAISYCEEQGIECIHDMCVMIKKP